MTGTAHGIGAAIAAASGGRDRGRGGQGAPTWPTPRGRRVLRRGRHVDILVNNAGGVVGQTGRPLEEVTEEDWHAVVDANLTGAFLAPGPSCRA